jgi:Leucine-rich repeat (LRR) protein
MLDLADFFNLRELNCSHNKLDGLILPTNITQINCRDNKLTNLILPPQLQQLDCAANKNLTTLT